MTKTEVKNQTSELSKGKKISNSSGPKNEEKQAKNQSKSNATAPPEGDQNSKEIVM